MVQKFEITDLGLSQGNDEVLEYGRSIDINKTGQIVFNHNGNRPSRNAAYFWANGSQENIGTLGGNEAWGSAINNNSMIVGTSTTSTNELHVFTWTKATGMVDIGEAPGVLIEANDINDHGDFVGWYSLEQNPDVDERAYIWKEDRWSLIPGLEDKRSRAYGINNDSIVVGSFWDDPSRVNGFIWSEQSGLTRISAKQNIPSQQVSGVYDINSSGTVIGRRSSPFFSHTEDSHYRIALPGSSIWPLGINTSVSIVGTLTKANARENDAWYFDVEMGVANLEELVEQGDWEKLLNAQAINDKGQIVGIGRKSDSSRHAFLLTPS